MVYWRTDNMMPVGQTLISIPSENGLSYAPGQKVQIFVGPETKFMSGRDSYLDFDFKIKLPAGKKPTKLQLDENGASLLIRNIRIFDGTRGNLLEEINSYDSYVSVKYDYDTNDSLRNLRALREGATSAVFDTRGTEGTSITSVANTVSNPYFKRVNTDSTTIWSDDDFLTAKCCVPINSGIFAGNDSVFPLMMTQGLYIEIDLNDASRVLKQLDSVSQFRRLPLNPHFHSINGSTAPDDWGLDTPEDTFYVSAKNNLRGAEALERFPFCVGETFKFCTPVNNTVGPTMSGEMEISEINLSATALGGEQLIQVVINAARSPEVADIVTESQVMYSTSVSSESSYDASYEVSNVNLVVAQVQLDPAYEKGMLQKVREGRAIEFDIHTATNYKHSILASDRQTTFQIFAQNSRAKSLCIVPQDSTVYNSAQAISASGTYSITNNIQDRYMNANRSAYTGISDRLSSIQFQLNGKLVPSRPVTTKKIATKNSIDAFHLYELEKTLDNAHIEPKSFSKFQENFVFGRGFSAAGQNGALDLRGKDLGVILKYEETAAPDKGKLFNSFVFHVRRLVIRDGGVEVQL